MLHAVPSDDLEPQRLIFGAAITAERTVAKVRIVVALLLGATLIAAAVSQLPTTDEFLMRQILIAAVTIGSYVALGVVSLYVATPVHYRPGMGWVFATLDVAFLLISVYAGLLNTGLGARYAIALPVIWLVPVVLAFGALRYEPWLQAYVGVLLAVGVVVPAAWEWSGAPASETTLPAALERFFALPPNAMRAAMVALAALVLTIAAWRTRALLIRVIEETRQRANLTRYMPPQIADWLARTPAAQVRRGQRRDVAVLFADIHDFTQMTETMDPEDVGRLVGEFRQRIGAVVDRHNGVIDKFIGDAAMIVFGIPEAISSDARVALACACDILAAVADWNRERQATGVSAIAVGIGGHFGLAFCGAIGGDARLEFTVLGDTVNVASRLQTIAKSTRTALVVSRDMLTAAGETFSAEAWRTLGHHQVRGRQQPIELAAWRLAPG